MIKALNYAPNLHHRHDALQYCIDLGKDCVVSVVRVFGFLFQGGLNVGCRVYMIVLLF